MRSTINLYEGDCLIEHENIKNGSVDLILTDLPYGTIKVIKDVNHGMSGKCEWDEIIDTDKIMNIANRILRKNGKMILFAQQPFTTELINKAIPNVPFNYSMIWEKDHFANSLTAKKAPLNYYEDMLVFSKNNEKLDFTKGNPLRIVMGKYVEKYGKDYIIKLFLEEGRYTSDISARVHASYKFGFTDGFRIDLMTKNLYDYLSKFINFKESYKGLRAIYETYHKKVKEELNAKYPSTFNLWEGNKYKSNILKYKKDYEGLHPTQKPVLLLEDLIKTFSNENDLVVDLTMGSGSTGIACINTNRNFIGIELDKDYFEIAKKRIDNHKLQLQLYN